MGSLGIYFVFDFDNQSAAVSCVETIKYCNIPSVPSGLEEVKTRPQGAKAAPEDCCVGKSLFFTQSQRVYAVSAYLVSNTAVAQQYVVQQSRTIVQPL